MRQNLVCLFLTLLRTKPMTQVLEPCIMHVIGLKTRLRLKRHTRCYPTRTNSEEANTVQLNCIKEWALERDPHNQSIDTSIRSCGTTVRQLRNTARQWMRRFKQAQKRWYFVTPSWIAASCLEYEDASHNIKPLLCDSPSQLLSAFSDSRLQAISLRN